MDNTPIFFTLTRSEEMSDEDYEVYAILIFPNNDETQMPQTVCVLPIDRETLAINIVDVEGEIMPTGVQAKWNTEEEETQHIISVESIKDAVVPRIMALMTMTITGYNFLVPEAQKAYEMESMLDVPTEELPEGEEFNFDTVDEFLKSTENDQ